MSYCNYVFDALECELIEDHFPGHKLVSKDHIEMYVNGLDRKKFKINCVNLGRDLISADDIDRSKIDFYISEYECIISSFPPKKGVGYMNIWAYTLKIKKEDAR